MSYALAYSRSQIGLDALTILVETHLANGLPSFNIVGLPETTVRESRERVRSALINSGFEFPQRRITVNLAPGDIPKDGTRFDLAIAIGILAASGQVPSAALQSHEFVGELALDGALRGVGAALATALAARRDGRCLVLAEVDAGEAAVVSGLRIGAAPSLRDSAHHLSGQVMLRDACSMPRPSTMPSEPPDLADIRAQHRARRALEIAAAGGHNLLFIGPPGTGKSMLAARLPGILPALDEEQALEVAALHSLAGLSRRGCDWRARPYRAPHHSASTVALIGGGRVPRPGEISLAHHGVLFLDELPEFERRALEALREPLETQLIDIARAARAVRFPAAFQLVCAMNSCPCGYQGDPLQQCICTPERIAAYRARISGPLAERIDLHVEVPRQTRELLQPPRDVEVSAAVRERVISMRDLQQARQACINGVLQSAFIERHCGLTANAQRLLGHALERLGLSARGLHKVLRVARTIADMSAAATIDEAHIAEAISYRLLDRRVRSS